MPFFFPERLSNIWVHSGSLLRTLWSFSSLTIPIVFVYCLCGPFKPHQFLLGLYSHQTIPQKFCLEPSLVLQDKAVWYVFLVGVGSALTVCLPFVPMWWSYLSHLFSSCFQDSLLICLYNVPWYAALHLLYLEFVELSGCVDLYLSLCLGSFQPLFLWIHSLILLFFFASENLAECATP